MAFSAISVPVLTSYNDKGIKKAEKDLKSLGSTLQRVSANALKAAANFVFFQGGTKLVEFGLDSVNNARDLERNLAGLGTIFGELTPQMRAFSEQAYSMGLSTSEAAKASTFLGSVLRQSGFSIKDTADLTQQLVALATDLSIVYGYDVQEALLGMTALFRGEYDPIEKFGVAMKQSQIDSEQAFLGLGHLTGAHERFAEQLIRIRFLFQGAQNASGAFQNQSNSLFAQQKMLNAEFQNMQAEIGQQLLPTFTALVALVRTELLPVLGPAIEQVFIVFINLVQSLIERKDELIPKILTVINVITTLAMVFANMTMFIVENINGIVFFGSALVTFFAISKGLGFVISMFHALTAGITASTGAALTLNAVLKRSIIGLAATIAVSVGAAMLTTNEFSDEMEAAAAANEKLIARNDELMRSLEQASQEGFAQWNIDEVNQKLSEMQYAGADAASGIDEITDAAGGAAKALDGVTSFYKNLYDEVEKQSARVRLQAMGASEGLIEAILGSGEEWRAVFQSVVSQGIDSVRDVQKLFAQTKAGFDEAMAEWESEVWNPFEQWRDQAREARDAMLEFVDSIEVLPTIERELGKFERAAADNLKRIEDDLADAFDNEYLLEKSYNQLLDYARKEFQVLSQIERQRDEIMARRNAAAQLIEQVNESVIAGANLVNILRDVENATNEIDIASVVKRTVQDSQSLREFSIVVTSAVVEPIDSIVSKAQQLTQGYRDIVERTREFVNNMKALRALGLDPTLFNELVEAGVDAGGATAKALIEGGTETVTEVNNLFAELNALGAELGEETAQVMYGQGENFVNGIVEGLTDQAQALEEQAKALATAFTSSFEEMLIAGIEAAIAAAEAALAKMPRFEGMPGIDYGQPSDSDKKGLTVPTYTGPAYTSPASVSSTGQGAIFNVSALNAKPTQNLLSGVSPSLSTLGVGANMRGIQQLGALPRNPVQVTVNNTRIDERTASRVYTRNLTIGSTPTARNKTNLNTKTPR